ncbi:MAG: TIGR04282 family arsenosugar biosynthesis glycosyltransferase [Actinomycetota bacterium]|nr:TIGR04282 family arsenosugar biosynthesis glycosyltransferase [Actinomycetota bacterium]
MGSTEPPAGAGAGTGGVGSTEPPRSGSAGFAGAGAGTALYIAAKAPQPGQVKTRLARAIGDEAAASLYSAFLDDLAGRFPDASWFVTSPEDWAGWPRPTLAQPAGDWTERQSALFRGAPARGESRVVLIASDSPQLPAATVAEAFRLLETHDVVLGPVRDGGYYLIGMRGWHDVLAGVAMSTSSVLEEVVACARARGLSLALVEPTYDVDEVDDLALLGDDHAEMPATRAALAALRAGVPA